MHYDAEQENGEGKGQNAVSSRGQHQRIDGHRGWVAPTAVAGVAVLLIVGGTAAFLTTRHAAVATARIHRPSHTVAAPDKGPAPSVATAVAAPLNVVSVSPAPGTKGISYAPTFTVAFSQPLAAGSPMPTISPALPGSWSSPTPSTLLFQSTANFVPYSNVTLVLPGGNAGIRDTSGKSLAASLTATYTVATGSTLRLQQLLAELGYMPLAFVPQGAGTPGVAGLASEPTQPAEVSLAPVSGKLVWRFPNTPASLQALWQAGVPNTITQGAVMAFEAAHGLATDGVAGPAVWGALVDAVAARQTSSAPYDYIMVSQVIPESLSVWQNGRTLFSVPTNTGIPQSPTQNGTWPVYERFLVTTMSGTNPNGTHYYDTGIPHTAYFHGGDAIHGFIRGSYGYPQSLGCVELTFANAATVWPYDQLGTLVTVY